MNPYLEIETELKKRWPYPDVWYRKQSDEWDNRSRFIYQEETFEGLVKKIAEAVDLYDYNKKEFFYYALNRWYNYRSASAVENIFKNQKGVVPSENSKNKLTDFILNGVSFDLKTTKFPQGFGYDLAFAKANPTQLINWLYANQSMGQRQHYANRLFLIVYAASGAHYKLKAEIFWLAGLIENYVSTFDASKLTEINILPHNTAKADIIWAIQ